MPSAAIAMIQIATAAVAPRNFSFMPSCFNHSTGRPFPNLNLNLATVHGVGQWIKRWLLLRSEPGERHRRLTAEGEPAQDAE